MNCTTVLWKTVPFPRLSFLGAECEATNLRQTFLCQESQCHLDESFKWIILFVFQVDPVDRLSEYHLFHVEFIVDRLLPGQVVVRKQADEVKAIADDAQKDLDIVGHLWSFG